MNLVMLIGRLTADPEIRYSQEGMAFGSFSLAVDRGKNKQGENVTDFIRIKVIGKNAEFAEKYLHKGMKIALNGSIQTGSYTDKDGKKVYTTDVLVNHMEFVEKKENSGTQAQPQTDADGFMNIPDGIDEELPFV